MFRNKLWLLQIPLILLFTAAFLVDDFASQGKLTWEFARTHLQPPLRRFSGTFTDLKFRLRGPQPPKNKIVIVEIDSNSIDMIGRWPWHRDMVGYLVQKIFENGAKVVGLDMFFSEADQRVPKAIADHLRQTGKANLIDEAETDLQLATVINTYRDRLVLGWAAHHFCQPLYETPEECPVTNPEFVTQQGAIRKFSYSLLKSEHGDFDSTQTPALAVISPISNLDIFNDVAKHAGYLNTLWDPDSVIRWTNLLMVDSRTAYPSLALEMARVGLKDELFVEFHRNQTVSSLGFIHSGRKLPVNPTGRMDINFRGPGHSFLYLPAFYLFEEADVIEDEFRPKLNGKRVKELLKDAYVLIGVSALGVYDMRAFPFEATTPGVEGHATILDNLLAGDYLISGASGSGSLVILVLMTLGALAFAYAAHRMESVPALFLFLVVFGGLGIADMGLFANAYSLNTVFLAMEFFSLFVVTLAYKYVVEERNRKFVRGAFAKYVSPVVVDSIMRDPRKLSLGGERKDLTILFSDIRSFTSFSEKMDAKQLAAFLRDYLGIMTDIVVENDGTLDKYIGDAIMAFWGAPLDQPDHAVRACRAAQQMLVALQKHRARWKEQFGIDVNIGVGVNTGIVSVGNMGSNTNFAYTVIGDHVNLASRLEGLTKHYGCGALTTRFSLDSISQAGIAPPDHRVVDHVKVKGKENSVELIQLLECSASPEALRIFADARDLYVRQRWNEAIEKFHVANQLAIASGGVGDGVALMYIERCKEFLINAPESGWDGAWRMEAK